MLDSGATCGPPAVLEAGLPDGDAVCHHLHPTAVYVPITAVETWYIPSLRVVSRTALLESNPCQSLFFLQTGPGVGGDNQLPEVRWFSVRGLQCRLPQQPVASGAIYIPGI